MSGIRPGPLTALSKLPSRIRARGWREVAQLAGHRLKEEIRSEDRLIFFLRPTGPVDSQGAGRTSGLELVRGGPEHAGVYERDIGTDSSSTFKQRLTGETRCYLVLDRDRALHATWVTTGASWVRELRRYFKPPSGQAYVYESFTRADARGRGVYPFALGGICAELGEEGIQCVWVAVEVDNAPSLKSVSKAGFEKAFEISYRRRWGAISLSDPQGPQAELCSRCFQKKLED